MALLSYFTSNNNRENGRIRTMKNEDANNNDRKDSRKETPLSAIAQAFEEISDLINKGGDVDDLRLKPFCEACSKVSVLFSCLGIAFKFAEMEYTAKFYVIGSRIKTSFRENYKNITFRSFSK
ncbi:putative glycolipid transfer protein superfamily [Helianthus annuus]|nr:putative glycolipid transfer protein superfamily [Helianthus annuus]